LPKNSKFILRREVRWPETPDVGCPPSVGRPDYGQVMGALSVAKVWT